MHCACASHVWFPAQWSTPSHSFSWVCYFVGLIVVSGFMPPIVKENWKKKQKKNKQNNIKHDYNWASLVGKKSSFVCIIIHVNNYFAHHVVNQRSFILRKRQPLPSRNDNRKQLNELIPKIQFPKKKKKEPPPPVCHLAARGRERANYEPSQQMARWGLPGHCLQHWEGTLNCWLTGQESDGQWRCGSSGRHCIEPSRQTHSMHWRGLTRSPWSYDSPR